MIGRPPVSLLGRVFGRLTVISIKGRNNQNRATWLCLCVCGNECVVRGDTLTTGRSQSCGCLQQETSAVRTKAIMTIHGHTERHKPSPEYNSWYAMKDRCTNAGRECYQHYGAKGITICARWINSFTNFLADMGESPEGTTLHRVDPAGNYEPSNCIWADWFVQNNRANKRPYQRRD